LGGSFQAEKRGAPIYCRNWGRLLAKEKRKLLTILRYLTGIMMMLLLA